MRLSSRPLEDPLVLLMVFVGFVLLSASAFFSWGFLADALLMAVFAIGGIASGLLRLRPRPLSPWLVLVGAVVMLALSVKPPSLVTGDASSYVLYPDLLSFFGHLVGIVGMVSLTRTSSARFSIDAALDALVLSSLTFLGLWVLLFAPMMGASALPYLPRILLVAIPAAGVFLFAVSLFVTFGRRGVRPSFSSTFFSGALLSLLAGDVLFVLAHLGVIPPSGRSQDLLYGFCAVLFGAAFSHSSMREVVRFDGEAHPAGVQRSVLLSAALLAPVFLLSIHTPLDLDRLVAGGAAGLLVAAALWRLLRILSSYLSQRNTLSYQAGHDHLTALPNRAHMESVLASHLAAEHFPLGVMFLDLDRFKYVNDSLGHRCGDDLLVQVASRLRSALPPESFVSRLGGDEFVVVVPTTSEASVLSQAEAVRAALCTPFVLDGVDVSIGTSVGVVVHERGASSADRLVHAADVALYSAKEQGRNLVQLYTSDLEAGASRVVAVRSALAGALERSELSLVYQPVVATGTGSLSHFEALLRWQHPVLGIVSPTEFIPLAEESGLIDEIGFWVLRSACSQVAAWRREGLRSARVAVNVSARQLLRRSFVSDIFEVLDELSLPGAALELELTESVLVENLPVVSSELSLLRESGISVALDDFGTGYSSLTYLRTLPVDRVKLDRSFVVELSSLRGRRLLASMLSLAEALELAVVAEGVETASQAELLVELGCMFAQGFFYSSPLTPDLVSSTFCVRPDSNV